MHKAEIYGYVFWYNGFRELWYAIPRSDISMFFSGRVDHDSFLSATHLEKLISAVTDYEKSRDTSSEFEDSKTIIEDVVICETCGREKVKDFDGELDFECHACL